jgi:hypothetical protein
VVRGTQGNEIACPAGASNNDNNVGDKEKKRKEIVIKELKNRLHGIPPLALSSSFGKSSLSSTK